MRIVVVATTLAAAAIGVAVAAARSFDCGKAATAVEKVVCGDAPLAALDVELARLYRLASTGKRAGALRSSEAKWRDERNACATAADVAACAVRSYVERIYRVRTDFPLARTEDAKGVSHGPFSIRCDGFDPVISIGYAGTDPSWAWAEWSGKGYLLGQALSGSGAKYEGPADGGTVSIWTKGMTAALVDLPGGKSFTACKVSGPR
jgi:uncharacterized protein